MLYQAVVHTSESPGALIGGIHVDGRGPRPISGSGISIDALSGAEPDTIAEVVLPSARCGILNPEPTSHKREGQRNQNGSYRFLWPRPSIKLTPWRRGPTSERFTSMEGARGPA